MGTIAGKASSMRYAGPVDGIYSSSITFYQFPKYMGLADMYTEGDGVFGENEASVIITGKDVWTIQDAYEDADVKECFCLYPGDVSFAFPGFYYDLKLDADFKIARLKKGCSCQFKLYPSQTP